MNNKNNRENLAAAYQILAKIGMDDLTYTHITIRSEQKNSFFIYPFNSLFKEVTASSLLEVSFDGEIISGLDSDSQYNKIGYLIHGAIYKLKDEVNSVFHLQTPAGTAVSAMKEGLLPISQFAYHFHENLAYYDYSSLILNPELVDQLTKELAQNKAMMLKNHGTISCGSTIWEAFFYCYYLEKACRTQCAAMNSKSGLFISSNEVASQEKLVMHQFEKDLGKENWLALIKDLEKNNSNYKE